MVDRMKDKIIVKLGILGTTSGTIGSITITKNGIIKIKRQNKKKP